MIAKSFNSHHDVLKCLCNDMNGNNLKLFLYKFSGSYDYSKELNFALSHAPDPAKLVLDAIPGFLSPQLQSHKSLSKSRIQTSCILLLEELMTISPSPRINPNVREEALKMASHIGSDFRHMYQSPVIAHGFLLFVAIYRIKCKYNAHELFGLLVVASRYKAHPQLCKALGFARKAEVLVRILIGNAVLGVIDYVYAHNLTGKFPPVRLLKDHLNLFTQRIDEQRDKLGSKKAANEEIHVIRTILKYITKYKLELEYPPEELENQISELEKKKKLRVRQIKSIQVDAPVTIEPSSKEESKLDRETRVKVEQPFPEKDSNLDNKAPVKGEPSSKEDQKLDAKAQVKSNPFTKKDSKLGKEKVEPSSKENPKLENQAQMKSKPLSMKYLKIENQAQVKVEPYRKKYSKSDYQTRVEAKIFIKRDSKLDNQAQIMVEPSLKEDPNLGNQAQVKEEPSPNEYSELKTQAKSDESSFEDKLELENREENSRNKDSLSTTSRRPNLGQIKILYENGLSFLSGKDKKDVNSSAHPFFQPSFYANMDGKSMIMFLSDIEDQDLLQDAVREILTHVFDPAKFVLDAMCRFSDSDSEFNKSLSLQKVIISLLEQLATNSVEISLDVKDGALKTKNEWSQNLGNPSNVYGFLLFIAVYGLVSNYEVDELLGLLLRANYHKTTHSLCRILGLQTNEVSVLVENLKQEDLLLEATEHIYEFELMSKFPPIHLLKYSLHARIRDATNLPSEDDVDRKLAAAKRFTVFIKKFELESEFTREDLEKYITELESQKVNISNVNTDQALLDAQAYSSPSFYAGQSSSQW